MSGTRSIPLRSHAAIVPTDFHRYLAAVALGLLSATAVVIVMRRAAGAFEESLAPGALAAIGALLAGVAAAV